MVRLETGLLFPARHRPHFLRPSDGSDFGVQPSLVFQFSLKEDIVTDVTALQQCIEETL